MTQEQFAAKWGRAMAGEESLAEARARSGSSAGQVAASQVQARAAESAVAPGQVNQAAPSPPPGAPVGAPDTTLGAGTPAAQTPPQGRLPDVESGVRDRVKKLLSKGI